MIPALAPLTVAWEAAKAAGQMAAGLIVRLTGKRWSSAREMRDAAKAAPAPTPQPEPRPPIQRPQSSPLANWIAVHGLPTPRRYGPLYQWSGEEPGPIVGWEAEWEVGPRSASLTLNADGLRYVEISLTDSQVIDVEYQPDDPAAPLALRGLLADFTPMKPCR